MTSRPVGVFGLMMPGVVSGDGRNWFTLDFAIFLGAVLHFV